MSENELTCHNTCPRCSQNLNKTRNIEDLKPMSEIDGIWMRCYECGFGFRIPEGFERKNEFS